MSKLLNQIKQDAKQALKQGNKEESKSLRYLASIIQTKQVEMGEEFDNSDAVSVLQKELKQKKESIEAFEKAGRDDLVEEEKKDLKLLNKYLPEMMDEEEIKDIAVRIKQEQGISNFGQLMGKVMAEVKGKAEGEKVAKVVKGVVNQ